MVVILGRAARSQSRTVRWAGTKQHDGGLLDWPGSARAHRPAKTKGTAPIQTELAALFVCLRAVRPGLEQYAASSPPRLHSDTIRIHSKAMKPFLVQCVCPGGGGEFVRTNFWYETGLFFIALYSEIMLAGIVTTCCVSTVQPVPSLLNMLDNLQQHYLSIATHRLTKVS